MNFLSKIYINQRRIPEALENTRQLLPLARKLLTQADHPEMITCLNTFSKVYGTSKMYVEALAVSKEVLEILSNSSGGTVHPNRLQELLNSAEYEMDLFNYPRAASLCEEWLSIQRRRLDFQDVHSTFNQELSRCLNILSQAYAHLQRYGEAVQVGEDLIEKNKQIYGMEHEFTLKAMTRQSTFYNGCGRVNDGVKVLIKVLEVEKRVFGLEHLETLATLESLAVLISS